MSTFGRSAEAERTSLVGVSSGLRVGGPGILLEGGAELDVVEDFSFLGVSKLFWGAGNSTFTQNGICEKGMWRSLQSGLTIILSMWSPSNALFDPHSISLAFQFKSPATIQVPLDRCTSSVSAARDSSFAFLWGKWQATKVNDSPLLISRHFNSQNLSTTASGSNCSLSLL